MEPFEELFALSERMKALARRGHVPEFSDAVERLGGAAKEVGEAFSGSWLGYHSRVYYVGLQAPPPGAHFSQEWGFEALLGNMGSRGDWREFTSQAVISEIERRAGNPDLAYARQVAEEAKDGFETARSEFMSIIESDLSVRSDTFLERLKKDVDDMRMFSTADVLSHLQPKGQFISRDMVAIGQGIQVPPHMRPIAEVAMLNNTVGICLKAAEKFSQAASHLERGSRRRRAEGRVGTNVFIGHGRSGLWRELKDFVSDRLRLPYDEFNRVPVAGLTNIARLSEMLDAAAVAFLVMTAEDELADGAMQARMNVVHEAGLFQGRLGFTKAIVVLEEGCAEFSNIQGLGQIRFPAGNIRACFEEIRQVLERENLVEA